MSQYCVRMSAAFPSADAADRFAREAEKLIGSYPKHEGTTVLLVINGQLEGADLHALAKRLGGSVEVQLVGDEN